MRFHYSSLEDFLNRQDGILEKGPVATILVEDDVEVDTTLRHHIQSGFSSVVVLMPDAFELAPDVQNKVHRVSYDCSDTAHALQAINRIIAASTPGCWMYYCYNAEYLFFPFCETRSVTEMLAFHSEERRSAMLTYVIDLYAGNLLKTPNAVSLKDAHLDKSGYYAQARHIGQSSNPEERQLDFYGGVRWRFEEHIPLASRKIDRISLFRCAKGLELLQNHTFNIAEYNTYSCPWHHNLTAAICSFRTAKALKRNPGSSFDIKTFRCRTSVPFEWHSRQLLDLGLIEPGQWF